MSRYTTQVRYIVETLADPKAVTINEKIATALPKIFDFDFPMYDEEKRTELESKIIRHYFNKEIGLETVGLWKFYLETRLNEIMPYYVKLYKSINIEYDIIQEYLETEDYKGGTTTEYSNTNKSENTVDSTNENTDFDFPQASINPALDYASGKSTGTNKDKSVSSNSGSGNNKFNNNYVITKSGRHRPVSELIKEYRETILNIDIDIINDLKNLFMLIY